MFKTKEEMDRHALARMAPKMSNLDMLPFVCMNWNLTAGKSTEYGLGWSRAIPFATNQTTEASYAWRISKRTEKRESDTTERKRHFESVRWEYEHLGIVSAKFDPLTMWLKLLNLPGSKDTERLIDQTEATPRDLLKRLVEAAE